MNSQHSWQNYFDLVFNKNDYIKYVQKIFDDINEKILTVEMIRHYKRKYFMNNVIIGITDILIKQAKIRNGISIKFFNTIDWNNFILSEVYQLSTKNDDIKSSEEQKEIISQICYKNVNNINFKDSFSYENNGRTFTITNMSIYLYHFMCLFKLRYQNEILLDMLEFNRYNNTDDFISNQNWIVSLLPKYKVKKRIIENIQTKKLYSDTLQFHMYYILNERVKDLGQYVRPYLLDRKLDYYQKSIIIQYMIFDIGIEKIIEEYLPQVDFETEKEIIRISNEEYQRHIIAYISKKVKRVRKIEKKLFYCKYLIFNNQLEGLKIYYSLIKKEMCALDDDVTEIINTISHISSIDCLKPILDIYFLSYQADFKNHKHRNPPNECKNALINIAMSDIKKNSHSKTIT